APTPIVKNTRHPVATATQTPTSTATAQPTATATQPPATTSTPASGGYPTLENQYNGTLYNTNSGTNAPMTLNSISQTGGNIRGNFQVGPTLLGSGPFTGTINTSGALQFVVSSSQVAEPLLFTGSVHNDGSMSGSYCSLKSGKCDYSNGYGSWTVSPLTSGSGS
ncbi:MAG TPA: hypothetical protein VJO32_09790, partial [Ktedonobacteraceae bacterium]|nr:hypothetical protein [Ktedonobacteraceae bacterium]